MALQQQVVHRETNGHKRLSISARRLRNAHTYCTRPTVWFFHIRHRRLVCLCVCFVCPRVHLCPCACPLAGLSATALCQVHANVGARNCLWEFVSNVAFLKQWARASSWKTLIAKAGRYARDSRDYARVCVCVQVRYIAVVNKTD